MLSYSAMTVADTAFVGAIGPAALAGVGLAGTLAFAVLVFGIGLLRGVKIVVSQAVGAGNKHLVQEVSAAGLIVALVMGLVVVLLAQLVVLFVPLLAASEQAGRCGADYFQVRMLGAPLVYIFCTTRETSYGLGNSRAPMVASLLANIVNISLDYVFIVKLEHGPSGAAWATVIATALEAGILLWLTKAPGVRCLAAGVRWLSAILRVGLATGAQFAVEVGAFTLLTVLVAAMSETQMAAHQVALCVVHFAFLPIVAFSEAASVMAGQAVGADQDELVPTIAYYALGMAVAYAATCTLILALGAPTIASLFGDDLEVRETAITLLYVAAAFQLGDAFNIVARGMLRGTGDVRVPAIICVTVSWLALPPLTWLLGHNWGMGAVGAWLALTCEITVVSGGLWWRLWKGGWRTSAAGSRRAIAAKI
ncbi:MAG: MATE family efflux transporter [Myxococcales bacterium]|nr:MATE family efflux transporter [Myxococcales bacterium]